MENLQEVCSPEWHKKYRWLFQFNLSCSNLYSLFFVVVVHLEIQIQQRLKLVKPINVKTYQYTSLYWNNCFQPQESGKTERQAINGKRASMCIGCKDHNHFCTLVPCHILLYRSVFFSLFFKLSFGLLCLLHMHAFSVFVIQRMHGLRTYKQ